MGTSQDWSDGCRRHLGCEHCNVKASGNLLPALALMDQLQDLHLDRNWFNGTLPPAYAHGFPALQRLRLDFNSLTVGAYNRVPGPGASMPRVTNRQIDMPGRHFTFASCHAIITCWIGPCMCCFTIFSSKMYKRLRYHCFGARSQWSITNDQLSAVSKRRHRQSSSCGQIGKPCCLIVGS